MFEKLKQYFQSYTFKDNCASAGAFIYVAILLALIYKGFAAIAFSPHDFGLGLFYWLVSFLLVRMVLS